MTSTQTGQLTTADGCVLAADIAEPDAAPVASVVVCHPHPLYGGNRFNTVVEAVFRALPPAGFRAIRFDFRSEHGHGVAETADVIAALDAVQTPGVPSFVVGYSFGAVVSLRTRDARVAGVVAIAPPLGAMTVDAPPTVPVLVLSPQHDQYCPPATAAERVTGWPDVTVEPVASVDHFLTGRAAAVAARTVAWLTARTACP